MKEMAKNRLYAYAEGMGNIMKKHQEQADKPASSKRVEKKVKSSLGTGGGCLR